jgi:hypothetical protein
MKRRRGNCGSTMWELEPGFVPGFGSWLITSISGPLRLNVAWHIPAQYPQVALFDNKRLVDLEKVGLLAPVLFSCRDCSNFHLT